MRKKLEWNWERLDGATLRAQVYGGWLILHQSETSKAISESMAFVSDPDHVWCILQPVQEKVAIPESQF